MKMEEIPWKLVMLAGLRTHTPTHTHTLSRPSSSVTLSASSRSLQSIFKVNSVWVIAHNFHSNRIEIVILPFNSPFTNKNENWWLHTLRISEPGIVHIFRIRAARRITFRCQQTSEMVENDRFTRLISYLASCHSGRVLCAAGFLTNKLLIIVVFKSNQIIDIFWEEWKTKRNERKKLK